MALHRRRDGALKTHRRATVTSALVLVLVFSAGTLVGRAWGDRDDRATALAAEGEVRDGDGSREREDRGRRTPMYEQVGITDAQRVAIDSIVVHYRSGVRSFQQESREAYEAGYRALVDSTREAIKGVMNARQRIEYDSLLRASDERRRERNSRRDGDDEDDGRND